MGRVRGVRQKSLRRYWFSKPARDTSGLPRAHRFFCIGSGAPVQEGWTARDLTASRKKLSRPGQLDLGTDQGDPAPKTRGTTQQPGAEPELGTQDPRKPRTDPGGPGRSPKPDCPATRLQNDIAVRTEPDRKLGRCTVFGQPHSRKGSTAALRKPPAPGMPT